MIARMRLGARRLMVRHLQRAGSGAALLGAALLLRAPAAYADPQSVLNGFRMNGCGDRPAAGTRLRPDSALDAVARELARDDRLEHAVERAAYPAASSTSFHVRGSREDDAIRRILAARYCDAINDPRYAELGVFQRGDETWIVLAVRKVVPPPLQATAVAERVLVLVNAARTAPRKCGRDDYAATQPLSLSAVLTEAAAAHARDMAARTSLTHRGADGSDSGERVTRAGYTWSASGENVAAGQRDADAVVAAWLTSPGHCATLMGPHFTEMGVAFALAPDQNPAIYWAQVFAAPR
jgi:uncharacterized protein YkwD